MQASLSAFEKWLVSISKRLPCPQWGISWKQPGETGEKELGSKAEALGQEGLQVQPLIPNNISHQQPQTPWDYTEFSGWVVTLPNFFNWYLSLKPHFMYLAELELLKKLVWWMQMLGSSTEQAEQNKTFLPLWASSPLSFLLRRTSWCIFNVVTPNKGYY